MGHLLQAGQKEIVHGFYVGRAAGRGLKVILGAIATENFVSENGLIGREDRLASEKAHVPPGCSGSAVANCELQLANCSKEAELQTSPV